MSPHKIQDAISGEDGGNGSPRHWIMGAEAFEARMPHHDGIKALWETKWKFPVSSCLSLRFSLYDSKHSGAATVGIAIAKLLIMNNGTCLVHQVCLSVPRRCL